MPILFIHNNPLQSQISRSTCPNREIRDRFHIPSSSPNREFRLDFQLVWLCSIVITARMNFDDVWSSWFNLWTWQDCLTWKHWICAQEFTFKSSRYMSISFQLLIHNFLLHCHYFPKICNTHYYFVFTNFVYVLLLIYSSNNIA
jgi:hypothetical protein